MKLIDYLLEHNLAADARTARGLIMRGDVLVNDRPQTSEHSSVPAGVVVRLRSGANSTDVSRGVLKLRPVVERLGFDCQGLIALDLGVSTGGFTQVLLELGAGRVYAVDVAYGTIDLRLRDDARVVLLERTNARELSKAQVPEPVARVVGDLSFISWAAVLPAVIPLLAPAAELLLLIKPQFELAAQGRGDLLDGGVVRDAATVTNCLASLYNTWQERGLEPQAVVPAGVRGAKGNQEYFTHLVAGRTAGGRAAYTAQVLQAVAEAE